MTFQFSKTKKISFITENPCCQSKSLEKETEKDDKNSINGLTQKTKLCIKQIEIHNTHHVATITTTNVIVHVVWT